MRSPVVIVLWLSYFAISFAVNSILFAPDGFSLESFAMITSGSVGLASGVTRLTYQRAKRADELLQEKIGERLTALAGIVAIVGVAVLLLWVGGILGNQGGGEGIEDVLILDTPPAEGRGELQVGTQKGQLAPDFEISDYDGSRHRLSDFRGQAVYVNIWATWCVPCLIEIPDIAELQDEFSDDLVIITVNRRESLGTAEAYFRNLTRLDGSTGVSFGVNGMDPDETLFDLYRAFAMPSSFFVDPDGVVTTVGHGLISLEQMRTAVNESLAGA